MKLADAQSKLNEMYRALVDNIQLRNTPTMVVHQSKLPDDLNMRPGKVWASKIQEQYKANIVMKELEQAQTTRMTDTRMTDLIPQASRQHIHQVDFQPDFMHDCIVIRFMFYNNRRIAIRVTDPEMEPVDREGFEEWQATAVMMSDAGEDVHTRPKPTVFGATASQVAANDAEFGSMRQAELSNSVLSNLQTQGGAGIARGFVQGLATANDLGGLLNGNPRR